MAEVIFKLGYVTCKIPLFKSLNIWPTVFPRAWLSELLIECQTLNSNEEEESTAEAERDPATHFAEVRSTCGLHPLKLTEHICCLYCSTTQYLLVKSGKPLWLDTQYMTSFLFYLQTWCYGHSRP